MAINRCAVSILTLLLAHQYLEMHFSIAKMSACLLEKAVVLITRTIVQEYMSVFEYFHDYIFQFAFALHEILIGLKIGLETHLNK